MTDSILGGLFFFVVLGIALAMPIMIYHRQSPKYKHQQETESIALGGKKMSRMSALYIVLFGIMFVLFLSQSITQGSQVSQRDLYISIIITVFVIITAWFFQKKYLPHQKETVKVVIIFSIIFLLSQLLLFLFK